jgi:hypothetical protein
MNSQRAIRRVLSLILVLSLASWAEAGLIALENSQSLKCARMGHMHQHMMHSALSPCCPSDIAAQLSYSAGRPNCCDVSNQPARPLAALVVPNRSLSVQLNASAPATAALVPRQQASAFPVAAGSPSFVKPVSDLKTDLRI